MVIYELVRKRQDDSPNVSSLVLTSYIIMRELSTPRFGTQPPISVQLEPDDSPDD